MHNPVGDFVPRDDPADDRDVVKHLQAVISIWNISLTMR
jgi:hypothetical protein